MSGIIDENGQQWEHCADCRKFVRFPQDLGYLRPTAEDRWGRDLCVVCADAGIRARRYDFDNITPASSWVATEVEV